nr:T9SS type A sorting domain-containing protein [Bacteroidota bacterium]
MKNFLTILLILISNALLSQYSFEYTIASDEDETFYNGIEDNNNNIILTGRIGNFDSQDWDPYILKIYQNGDTMSKRIMSADTSGWFQTVELLNDGNYLFLGQSAIQNGSDFDHLWVCKMDTALNIVFQKAYKMTTDFYFSASYSISFTDSDHNIVLSGGVRYYTVFPNYHWDMAFAKLNQQGDTLLTKIHHNEFEQRIFDISQIPNTKDYLAIAGNFGYYNFGPVRFDSAFNIIEIKHFYNNILNLGNCKWLSDTSYLFATIYHYDTKDENQISIYKIDTALNYQQQLTVGKIDTADYPAWRQSIAYANDTTIYIGGMEMYIGFWVTTPNVLELYVIDRELNLLGYKEFGSGDANYQLWGIMPTSDMGCLLYGTRYSEENGNEFDIHIIKVLREDIEISISPITATNEMLHQMNRKPYPNPAYHTLNIPLNEYSGLEDKRLQIFNINGKKVTDRYLCGDGNVLQVNTTSLTPGMYLYTIHSNGGKSSSGKFIKN